MGRAFERAKQHTEELSRINVDNAKTVANTATEFAANNRQRKSLPIKLQKNHASQLMTKRTDYLF